jgi:hypothetical protein
MNKKQMDQASKVEQSKIEKGLWGWFVGFGVLLLLSVAVGWFDNTTELRPSHDGALNACFALAGLSGLICGVATIRMSKRLIVWRRIAHAIAFAILGFILVFLVSVHAVGIIDGLIDFPPGKTKSYTALLLISRAYQTHGKSRSWNIQTTPIWSNLDITEDDYEFMLAHRRPGDPSRNPDEISSKGYFCAQVTIQQSGNALRVMHAGSRKLPKGTVIICPSSSGSNP